MNERDEVQRIHDAGGYSYFSMIPNLLDDLPLTTNAYRLYGHYKRRAGERQEGHCFERVEKTAQLLGWSKSTVLRARRELEQWGLIKVKQVPQGHGEFPYSDVTLTDLWPFNYELYWRWSYEQRELFFGSLRSRQRGDEVSSREFIKALRGYEK